MTEEAQDERIDHLIAFVQMRGLLWEMKNEDGFICSRLTDPPRVLSVSVSADTTPLHTAFAKVLTGIDWDGYPIKEDDAG